MTERDMEKMLCYLADKVDRLEKERCDCHDEKTLRHVTAKPPAHDPKYLFKTIYDEEEDCPSCSS